VARLEPEVPKREEKVGRFIKNDNGTTLDTKTNLMWMTQDFRNIERRAPDNWDEAMAWAEKMNQQRYGGYSDWRVPTTAEYQAIYNVQATRRSYRGGKIGYPAAFEDGGGVWLWSEEIAAIAGVGGWSGPRERSIYGYDFRLGLVSSRLSRSDYSGDESIRLVRSGP
jgi:hypothetical protein